MPTRAREDPMVIPAAFFGCAAVAAAGLAATVVVPDTIGRLLVVAAAVGVLSALVADPRVWIAVTAAGVVVFLVATNDGENGWPFLFVLGLAAVLGRGQRWLPRPRAHGSNAVD